MLLERIKSMGIGRLVANDGKKEGIRMRMKITKGKSNKRKCCRAIGYNVAETALEKEDWKMNSRRSGTENIEVDQIQRK